MNECLVNTVFLTYCVETDDVLCFRYKKFAGARDLEHRYR